MGIQVLNGVLPKRSRLTPVNGGVLHNGVAAAQHATTAIGGTSYQSPFTESSKPLFNGSNDNAQQIQMDPLMGDGNGNVVTLAAFGKVEPTARGTFFSTTPLDHHVVKRTGGPSPTADTPANPNHPKLRRVAPPRPRPTQDVARKSVLDSFQISGGTMTGHADQRAGTSHGTPRWNITKRGAAG